MHLLDTDILVGFLRNQEEAVNAVKNLSRYGISTSAITMHELFDGAFRGNRRDRAIEAIVNITNSIEVLPFDTQCSRISGMLKAETIAKGRYPGELDILIASVALRNGMKLVSRNKKNYESIPGLILKIW